VELPIISAHRMRYASPQPNWTTLARLRFVLGPVPLETISQWLDFWETEIKRGIAQLGAEIKFRRSSEDQDRQIILQAGRDRLIIDGNHGRVLLWPANGALMQWATADACREWRRSSECLRFSRECGHLNKVAEYFLNRTAAEMQFAIEGGRCSVWARPNSWSDFEMVPPDRWRLYRVRPIKVIRTENPLENGRRQVLIRPDFVDADCPDGSVLCSIYVAPVRAKQTVKAVDLVPANKAGEGDKRYRYTPARYDPIIERHAKDVKRQFGKEGTQAEVKRRCAADFEARGWVIPKKTTFDNRVKKIFDTV
jgi:hypothetical protein